MVSTLNTSRSNSNPPRMQDPPSNADNRPPGALEAMQANTDDVEALRLTNQRLIGELEQLTRQMQRPREARQTQKGHNLTPHEGQHILGTPRGAETEAESSRAKGHGPHLAPGEEGNEATLRGHVGNEELRHPQQGAEYPKYKLHSNETVIYKKDKSTRELVKSFPILHEPALKALASFQELEVGRQREAVQFIELFR